MRKIHAFLTAGAMALPLATASAFAGENPKVNQMTVRLPGGGVAQIEYTGDTPPKVVIGQADPIFDAFWGVPPLVRFGPPAADFDRLQQALERRVEAILRDARALRAGAPEATIRVGNGGVPGSFSYSFMSSSSDGKTCTHSVRITTPADGGKPKVVEQTSGDCADQNVKPKSSSEAETL